MIQINKYLATPPPPFSRAPKIGNESLEGFFMKGFSCEDRKTLAIKARELLPHKQVFRTK